MSEGASKVQEKLPRGGVLEQHRHGQDGQSNHSVESEAGRLESQHGRDEESCVLR